MASPFFRRLPGLSKDSPHSGLLAAFVAFFCWGLMPLFWKALSAVDPVEVLFQRMFWSFLCITLYMLASGRFGPALAVFASPRALLTLAGSGLLLSLNWYLYIHAIISGQVIEASLGYFINPLLNIVIGMLLFRERISLVAWLSIVLACGGVAFQALTLGHFPFIALGLSCSFALYGLLRKIVIVEALPGLFVETALMLPVAGCYLLWQGFHGVNAFFRGDPVLDVLLISSGVITSIPLFLFAYGARRIRMTTLGLMQYVSPSMVFLLGIFLYREPLTLTGFITFACIWCALALYSWDSIRAHRKTRP